MNDSKSSRNISYQYSYQSENNKSDSLSNGSVTNNYSMINPRYFDIYNVEDSFCFEEKTNNSICDKCGKEVNSKCNCASQNFCHICLSRDHTKKNCPKFNRCNKCLKEGHLGQNCTEILNSVCANCKIANHKSEDCLKYPNEITLEDIKKTNAKVGDHEGIVNVGRKVEGVLVSIFLRETEENIYKVSLRSNTDDIKVSEIAEKFDGGGHNKAAGCMICNTLDKAMKELIKETNKCL